MTTTELKELKAAIKAEMARRNGIGSLTAYASSNYDFTNVPTKDKPIYLEHGQKTIDLLLKIEDYGDLIKVKENGPIPKDFNGNLIKEINRLSTEKKTGESAKTVKNLYPSRQAETSSCRGACTGLCVGTCTGNCNGCTSCTATCGTGCTSGCYSCSSGCSGACKGCNSTCTGGCNANCSACTSCTGCNGCSGSCQGQCTGATAQAR